MARRVLIVLLLAGCASPAPSPAPHAPQPAPSAQAPAQPSAPIAPATSGDAGFDAWRDAFRSKAVAAGLSTMVVDRELAGLTPNTRVISLDSAQPEFSKPIGDYIKGVVSDERIARGQRYRVELPFWDSVEQQYGVPRDILMAVWAMESAFGAVQGDFDVVRSMSSLAYHGRRRAWAEGELISALRIIQSGEATRTQLKGSWAGAMGQTQFLPSNYLSTAVDADGDSRRDIWRSPNDALASAANLLAKGGWQRGGAWAREVALPQGFDYSLTEGPREPVSYWEGLGVRTADGQAWKPSEQGAPAQLVAPAGASGPVFLLFPNHFAIRKYNNSTSYALGIGLLADRFAGGGPLVAAWPVEQPMAIGDRIAAQTALARLGFNPGAPDGVVGVNTRTALRAWQKARGLVADGYLSAEMVRRLNVEAGALPAQN
ncbi:lytic murein transglycosylase [Phenylobacterium koreense]|uniref:Lytic murein transglycosylase n=2 Tax=Phenylobacterium TaxID=20 RepID=A0ABV2EGG3_9CAUL